MDNIKQFNTHIIGVPEKGGEAEKIFEEMARIFPNEMKTIKPSSKSSTNSKKTPPRHSVIIKLLKTNDRNSERRGKIKYR